MKIYRTLKLALLALPLLFACSQSDEDGPIKIGTILPTSGAAAQHSDIAHGMKFAIDEVNRHGGINGRPLEMRLSNNESNPEVAKRLFDKLESDYRPHLYISSTSFISLALAPRAEKSKVVLAALIAASPKLTANRDWLFRYYATIEQEVAPILEMLAEHKIKRVGIIHLDDDVGTTMFNHPKERFEATGGKVFSQPFNINDVHNDFSEEVAALRHLEAIYIVGYESHTEEILRQLRKVAYKGLKLSGSSGANLPRQGPEIDGLYVSASNFFDVKNKNAARLKRNYEGNSMIELSYPAAMGYDFVRLLTSVLRKQKRVTRESVREALSRQISYAGVFGNLNKDGGAHDIGYPSYPAQVIAGRLVYLK